MSELLERIRLHSEDPTKVEAIKEWESEQGAFGVYDMGRGFTRMAILFHDGEFWMSMMYAAHLKEYTVKDAIAIAKFAGLTQSGPK